MRKKSFDTRKMVMISILIAMQIIFERFVAPVQLSNVRISFTFIPMSLCSILFGPLAGGLSAALADFLGMVIAPTGQGGYFPGFALSIFISGASYGFFTRKFGVKTIPILMAVLVSCLGMSLVVETFWLKILMGEGYLALLPARIVKAVLMIPVQTVLISVVWKYLGARIQGNYSQI